jgi:hypothetical protein
VQNPEIGYRGARFGVFRTAKTGKKPLICIIYAAFTAFFNPLFLSAKPLKPGLSAMQGCEKYAI